MTTAKLEQAANLLRRHAIFSCVSQALLLEELRAHAVFRTFHRGESVQVFSRSMGMLLQGRARVCKGEALINELSAGELFGAVTLFRAGEEAPTSLFASVACEVVFLPQELVRSLMEQVPDLAQAYIRYLSERVGFLTRRIAAYTSGSAGEKLCCYLREHGTLTKPNYSMLAKQLNMGRASLYRVLNELEEGGVISRQGGEIRYLKEETT